MRKLQLITRGFLGASVLFHILVVVDLFILQLADWPRILWILHAGILICFIPAVIQRSKRLSAEGRSGKRLSWKTLRRDVVIEPKQRYVLVFGVYGTLLFYLDIVGDPAGDVDNWLLLSTSWMAIYYLTLRVVRREIREEH